MDCHKWLNVPYDCGFVAVADREAHYAATRMTAAYLVPAPESDLDPFDWIPEASRRGRATTVYAALRMRRLQPAEARERASDGITV